MEGCLTSIPPTMKLEYLEALQGAPLVLEVEAHPNRWNQRASYWSAAVDYVLYWKMRKTIFGSRALLPMTLDGEGAMNEQDLAVLSSGFLTLVDSVIVCDPSQLTGGHLTEALRSVFYLAHWCPSPTYTAVVVVNQADLHPALAAESLLMQVVNCLPSQPQAILFVPGMGWSDLRAFTTAVSLLVGRSRALEQIAVVPAELLTRRVPAAALPEHLGGTLSWSDWMVQLIGRGLRVPRPVAVAASSPALDTGLADNPACFAQAQAELDSAIALLPEADKAALLEARALVPDLYEKESPPLRFLRHESFNLWAAARRLAMYWKTRKELFGDRAFLPMNQTGEGTLTRDDIIVLSSGFYTLLPTDHEGRAVICGHPSRRGDHSRAHRLRLAFYMWSIVAENEESQKSGCVILAVLQKPVLDRVVREASAMVQEALPLRVYRVHVVNPPLKSEERTFLESLVPLCLKLFGTVVQNRAKVHVASTHKELLHKLTAEGLKEEGIPEDLGGQWKYEFFAHWQELRMCYEWELPVVGARNTDFHCIPHYHPKARSELTAEEKVERKRRLNVLHSRRKRSRSKVEKEVLSGQVAELQQEHAGLKEESDRLQELLKQAENMVSTIKTGGGVSSLSLEGKTPGTSPVSAHDSDPPSTVPTGTLMHKAQTRKNDIREQDMAVIPEHIDSRLQQPSPHFLPLATGDINDIPACPTSTVCAPALEALGLSSKWLRQGAEQSQRTCFDH